MLAVGPRSTQREYFLDAFSTNRAQLLLCQPRTGVMYRFAGRGGVHGEPFADKKFQLQQRAKPAVPQGGVLMHAYCDFDGTIAEIDVTDAVLERFASAEWRRIERAWEERHINARQCMSAQVALIRASMNEIDAFLNSVKIDPGFPEFVNWCATNMIPVTVVSDGVDRFIRRILANHGLDHLDIIANRLRVETTGDRFNFSLDAPFSRATCGAGSGVCKCAVVQSDARQIYVGDGRSDFCVSSKVDLLFAKHALAVHCTRNFIPFVPYTTFKDVQNLAAAQLQNLVTFHDAGLLLSQTA